MDAPDARPEAATSTSPVPSIPSASASPGILIKTEPGIDEGDIDLHELPSSPADVEPDEVIDQLFEAVESGDTRDFKRLLYTGLIKSSDPVSKSNKAVSRSPVKRTLPAPIIFKYKKSKQVTDSAHNILRNGDLPPSPLVIKQPVGQRLVIRGSQVLVNKDGTKQVVGKCETENTGRTLKLNPDFVGVKPSNPQTVNSRNPGIKTIRLDSELGHSLIRPCLRRRRRRRNVVVDFLQGRTFTVEGNTVVAKQSGAENDQAAEGVDFVVGDVDIEKEKEIKSDIKNRNVHMREAYEYVLNSLNENSFPTHIDTNKGEQVQFDTDQAEHTYIDINHTEHTYCVTTRKAEHSHIDTNKGEQTNNVEVINTEKESKVEAAENVNNGKTETDTDFDDFNELVIDCGDTSETRTQTEHTRKGECTEIKQEVEKEPQPYTVLGKLKEFCQTVDTAVYREIKTEPQDSDQTSAGDYNQTEGIDYRLVKVEQDDISSDEVGHLNDSDTFSNVQINSEPDERQDLNHSDSFSNVVIKTEPDDEADFIDSDINFNTVVIKTEPVGHYPCETAVSGQLNVTNRLQSSVQGTVPEVRNNIHFEDSVRQSQHKEFEPTSVKAQPLVILPASNIDVDRRLAFNNLGLLRSFLTLALPNPPTTATAKPKSKSKKKKGKGDINQRFTCEHCPKIFRARTLLSRHVRRVHSAKVTTIPGAGEEEKTFACTVCDKTFTTAKSQRSHERIHSGEKQIKCELCDKVYSSIHVLKRHLEILHSGDRARPFQCGICDYSSTFRCHLIEHLRTHTGEQPYDCPVCKKKFSHVGTMNRHAKQVHNYDTAAASYVLPKDNPEDGDPDQTKKLQYILPKLASPDLSDVTPITINESTTLDEEAV